jgi:hypothetical protein
MLITDLSKDIALILGGLQALHMDIGCQNCHGALLEHSTAATEDAQHAMTTVKVAVPTDEVCIRCHAQTEPWPSTLKQIVPAQHDVSQCLQCRDPHSSIANRPPVVLHPLYNLTNCLTCHGPEGFKARNHRHPSGDLTVKERLDCHAARRGPEDTQVTP